MKFNREKCLCVDIGTSKIIFCSYKGNQIILLNGSLLQKLHSSGIFYKNRILMGHQLEGKNLDPRFLITNIKSYIARDYKDNYICHLQDTSSFNIGKDENQDVMIEVMENDKLVLKSPSELLSLVLKEAMRCYCPEEKFEYLFMAYPPSFSSRQIKELKRIAKSTGIRHISSMSESKAASYHYGCQNMKENEIVVVCDLGAGTYDLSLLVKKDGQLNELFRGGDSTIGGNSVTQLLFHYVKDCFEKMDVDVQNPSKLYEEVEKVKIELATNSVYTFSIKESYVTLSQKMVGVLCEEYNNQVLSILLSFVKDCGKKPNILLLSGRGFLLPSLREKMRDYCYQNGIELRENNIFDEPVVYGLARAVDSLISDHSDDDQCGKSEENNEEIGEGGENDVENEMNDERGSEINEGTVNEEEEDVVKEENVCEESEETDNDEIASITTNENMTFDKEDVVEEIVCEESEESNNDEIASITTENMTSNKEDVVEEIVCEEIEESDNDEIASITTENMTSNKEEKVANLNGEEQVPDAEEGIVCTSEDESVCTTENTTPSIETIPFSTEGGQPTNNQSAAWLDTNLRPLQNSIPISKTATNPQNKFLLIHKSYLFFPILVTILVYFFLH